VFNATFSNISAISWRPVLVVEEAGVLGENPSVNSSRIGHHRFGGVMVSVLASSEVDRGRHDIAEILLKVALNTINHNQITTIQS
jgi:hypothetical protein